MERRKMHQNGDAEMHAAKRATELFRPFPHIVMHVTCCLYGDGTPRQPGWIVLRTFRGCWELVAKEPDACLSLTVADPNLDDCWVLLETLLGDPNAPWQHDPYLQGKGSKKYPKSR